VNLNQVTLPTRDIAESKRFYKLLGLRLIVDAPDYARFEFPDGDSTLSISLSEGAIASDSGSVYVYFECDDLDACVTELRLRGVAFEAEPEDKRWLWREAWLRDPSGNLICLIMLARTARTHLGASNHNEMSQQFSMTRKRIHQIEAEARRKLKHPSRSRTLRSFLEN